MSEGKQSVTAFATSILREMRKHAFAAWPWATAWVACLAGALLSSGAGVPPMIPMILSLAGFVFLIFWEARVLGAMMGGRAKYSAGKTEIQLVISSALYMIILLFGAVIILFPVILSTMALWALVNLDMEAGEQTQEELAASFEAFQTHPLFALCVLIFVAGLVGLFALMMRGRAYAAASVSEQRVVAMEAFNWTRGSTIYLLCVGLIVLLPFLLLMIGAGSVLAGLQDGGGAARVIGAVLFAISVWPVMLALQSLSVAALKWRPPPAPSA